VHNNISNIRMLNQHTFFLLHELPNMEECESAVHIEYRNGEFDTIETLGLSPERFEEVIPFTFKKLNLIFSFLIGFETEN
jgi:hypothetical protein